ncbi:hypothetical protein WR25_08987 [Diploscapter pachys]|uniref:CHK kinase-like domain-containing protein n=1 Tax=Diploscapter pachys TaxID=2018661 RepID=A0A2A2M1U5_9BILA|nr:hypothetical protein WR25_08987 [Diploscapter pachys]
MGCRPSTPEVVPSPPVISEVPSDPKNHRSSFRPSISSLQIPKGDYNIDQLTESDAASEHSGDNEQDPHECIYGTDITLEWLLQRLKEKFGSKVPAEPQWITERLNRPHWNVEYATSSVVRVTFGWEDEELPKSVVIKTPVAKGLREESEEGKYHFIIECNVYEWTQRYPKLASPRIFTIRKHSKEGSGVVIMQDASVNSIQCDAIKGLKVDVMRDLLKHLAYLHAASMKHTSWSTLIADLPPSYYAYVLGNFEDIKNFFERKEVDHSRFVHTAKYFNTEYLHTTATESADHLKVPKVLVHGEPYASNIFVSKDGKSQVVSSVIDWTECHSGCFAEDLCKAICWNMAPKDRTDNTANLLEGYHYHLVRYCNGECPITVDAIRKAYDKFLPFAMVSFAGKVVHAKNKPDIEPLVERAKALIQQVYATARLAMSSNAPPPSYDESAKQLTQPPPPGFMPSGSMPVQPQPQAVTIPPPSQPPIYVIRPDGCHEYDHCAVQVYNTQCHEPCVDYNRRRRIACALFFFLVIIPLFVFFVVAISSGMFR